MKITIDENSGFCFGVVYAIEMAENILENQDKLYCLGDIVHNDMEVERLKNLGLIIINHNQLKEIKNASVLIRAHGEPPETYELALKNNLKLIDASCPVVLKLQNQIKNGYKEIKKIDGQVVIYGKKGHAEVTGLIGQTNGNAIIVESLNDIDKIDFSRPISIYSQTTKSPKSYSEIIDEIKKRSNSKLKFIVKDTLCRQVSGREPQLQKFSNENQVIIFVSGKKSSNGKMLYESCKKVNPNSYFISSIKEIKSSWFRQKASVGICGATSTPLWLMQKVAQEIADLSL